MLLYCILAFVARVSIGWSKRTGCSDLRIISISILIIPMSSTITIFQFQNMSISEFIIPARSLFSRQSCSNWCESQPIYPASVIPFLDLDNNDNIQESCILALLCSQCWEKVKNIPFVANLVCQVHRTWPMLSMLPAQFHRTPYFCNKYTRIL